MSATNSFETSLLQHILQNADIANIGDATGLRGSATAGVLYISLHTADPGEPATQQTSEATFTGYARVSVVRSGAGWTVSGTAPTTGVNAAAVNFPPCTGGTNTITHFGIGTAASGAGVMLLTGALGASLSVSNGITPSFGVGTLVITCE